MIPIRGLRTSYVSREPFGELPRFRLVEKPVEERKKRVSAPLARWTADDDARLRKLWSGDVFAREIGEELGRSKCSVIARANRIGLARRDPVVWRHRR